MPCPLLFLFSFALSRPYCALREIHFALIVGISIPNVSLISERAFSFTSRFEYDGTAMSHKHGLSSNKSIRSPTSSSLHRYFFLSSTIFSFLFERKGFFLRIPRVSKLTLLHSNHILIVNHIQMRSIAFESYLNAVDSIRMSGQHVGGHRKPGQHGNLANCQQKCWPTFLNMFKNAGQHFSTPNMLSASPTSAANQTNMLANMFAWFAPSLW